MFFDINSNSFFYHKLFFVTIIWILLLSFDNFIKIFLSLKKKLNKFKSTAFSDTGQEDGIKSAAFFSVHDPLTMLPNRDFMITHLEKKLLTNEKNSFSLLLIGIDRFKTVNSLYGQIVGDLFLKEVSEGLKNILRDKDLVTRWGGDKFMILLNQLDSKNNILIIIRRIFNLFSNGITIQEHEIKLSVSIGVANYPMNGKDSETLLKNCEVAMDVAKSKKQNSFRIFNDNINIEFDSRLKLEKELQKAIINEEFIPYFQPKLSYDGRLVGMESLIRWQSDSLGFMPPFKFIPFAEENGMITSIGKIILKKSCKQIKKWHDQGFCTIRVSVNLSPFEFTQEGLVDGIKNILKDVQLDPRFLELEITESGLFKNEDASIDKILQLRKLGISISIDDFGTGYSSLSKLKDYPIDTLKIDKSFVDPLPSDEKSAKISLAIIDLAHNLNFEVVAEGVEEKSQLDFLHEQGCDQYQGYYFNKPLPADQFEEFYFKGK